MSPRTQRTQPPAAQPFSGRYAGKRVFVTGHTGFKGSWLCDWLLKLGADVTGFSLSPPTKPALFDQLGLSKRMKDIRGDIRHLPALHKAMKAAKPDFVFHLAAQSLVRSSYERPVETFEVNLMGTVNVLECLRAVDRPCAAVLVTTDKCYENREWVHGYREEDPLGGHDPYSASKATAEIAIGSYRRAFFKEHTVRIASARAGNVIGGGDWARDRIVPDCIRALARRQPVGVRNPRATRPWQHVLEPLGGYLWLGARLIDTAPAAPLCSAFNFGPGNDSNRTVGQLVAEVLKHWPGRWEDRSNPATVHEATFLHLSTDKAYAALGWSPVWTFDTTVGKTVDWYRRALARPADIRALVAAQIAEYEADAARSNQPWATV